MKSLAGKLVHCFPSVLWALKFMKYSSVLCPTVATSYMLWFHLNEIKLKFRSSATLFVFPISGQQLRVTSDYSIGQHRWTFPPSNRKFHETGLHLDKGSGGKPRARVSLFHFKFQYWLFWVLAKQMFWNLNLLRNKKKGFY